MASVEAPLLATPEEDARALQSHSPAGRQRRQSGARQPRGSLPILSHGDAVLPPGVAETEGQHVRLRRASMHAVLLAPTSDEASVQRAEGEETRGREAPILPAWWLFMLTLYCVPLLLTNVLFSGILLPPLLQNIVNTTTHFEPETQTTKQSAMGAVTTLVSIIHLSVPFWGWLADRATFRCCRSTFVVVGQLMAIAGLTLSAITARGCYPHGTAESAVSLTGEGYSHLCSWRIFLPGFMLFHAGYLIGWVPYMAVIAQSSIHCLFRLCLSVARCVAHVFFGAGNAKHSPVAAFEAGRVHVVRRGRCWLLCQHSRCAESV